MKKIIIDSLKESIEYDKAEYNRKLEVLKRYLESESGCSNFEENAISELLIMLKIKNKINTNKSVLDRLDV